MSPRLRHLALVASTTLVAGSLLTACNVSLAGGIAGGSLGATLLLIFLLGGAAQQTGCKNRQKTPDTREQPSDDAGVERTEDVGPSRTVTPGTRRAAQRDAGADRDVEAEPKTESGADAPGDLHLGPCLKVEYSPEDESPDAGRPGDSRTRDLGSSKSEPEEQLLGPCLSVAPPESQQSKPERQKDDSDRGRICLIPLYEGGQGALDGADADAVGSLSYDDRSRLREKYRGRLPDDVLARLDDGE